MPSRKQQRRRLKERRHEYEYVYVDDEGRELDPEEVEVEQEQPKRPGSRNGARPPVRGTGGRIVQPPSWRRVGKRALIFAPLMYLTITFLSGEELSVAGRIVNTAVLLAFFLPFSYVMDSMLYRSFLKRSQATKRQR